MPVETFMVRNLAIEHAFKDQTFSLPSTPIDLKLDSNNSGKGQKVKVFIKVLHLRWDRETIDVEIPCHTSDPFKDNSMILVKQTMKTRLKSNKSCRGGPMLQRSLDIRHAKTE